MCKAPINRVFDFKGLSESSPGQPLVHAGHRAPGGNPLGGAPLKFIPAGREGGEEEGKGPRVLISPVVRIQLPWRAGFLWNDIGPQDPHWLRLSS